MTTLFEVGNRVTTIERERVTMIDVFSEAGGFIEFFVLAVSFVLSSHQEFSFKISIIRELFDK